MRQVRQVRQVRCDRCGAPVRCTGAVQVRQVRQIRCASRTCAPHLCTAPHLSHLSHLAHLLVLHRFSASSCCSISATRERICSRSPRSSVSSPAAPSASFSAGLERLDFALQAGVVLHQPRLLAAEPADDADQQFDFSSSRSMGSTADEVAVLVAITESALPEVTDLPGEPRVPASIVELRPGPA